MICREEEGTVGMVAGVMIDVTSGKRGGVV